MQMSSMVWCGSIRAAFLFLFSFLFFSTTAMAQVTPAAGYVTAGRHAGDPGRRHDLCGLHVPDGSEADRRRWQFVFAQLVRREAGVHQRHRQHLPPYRVSRHARHRSRDRHRELAERQLYLPAEIRIRTVQLRRLDDARIVGTPWRAANPLGRLHGNALALSLPGHDLRGSRGLPVVVGLRRHISLQLWQELWRRAHRLLQRRELQPNRAERSEGFHDPRHAAPASPGPTGDSWSAHHWLL